MDMIAHEADGTEPNPVALDSLLQEVRRTSSTPTRNKRSSGVAARN